MPGSRTDLAGAGVGPGPAAIQGARVIAGIGGLGVALARWAGVAALVVVVVVGVVAGAGQYR